MSSEYFLKVAGIAGGSLDKEHKGEFDVLGYEFDLAAMMSHAGGGGGGTGKTTFSPLILDLAATPGLADLLKKAALGQHIPEVTFTAEKASGGGEAPFAYQTIKLTDVFVIGYEEQAGFAPRVALGYGQIEVTLTEQSPTGGPAPDPVTVTFDVHDALGTVAPGALEPVVKIETSFDYFLKVDGIAGSSIDKEHKGEFDIVGYEFDLAAAMSHAGGGGSGTGKTTLSPLVVDFEFSPGLAALLKKAATGAHIPELTFTVEKPLGGGAAPFTYQTITLKNVTVLDYEENDGFPTRVAFGYDEIELTINEQTNTGTEIPHVFAWNIAENHVPVITTPPTETPAEVTDGAFTAAGQVSFIDPDGDQATASAALFELLPVGTTLPADALALLRPLLEAAFQINPATGAWQFNLPQDAAKLLAANEVLEIVYRVTVSDGAPGVAALAAAEAAATTQDIVISIEGVNDAPVIDSIATRQVNELADTTGSSALDTVAVQATFNDADLNDTGHTGAVVSVAASGATAGLALSSAALLALLAPGAVTKQAGTSQGTASYVFSAPDKTFDYLKAGQKLTLTYTIAVDDHDGGVSTQTAIVEINGANDAPAFTSPALFSVQENNTAAGTVVATDIEGESLSFKLVGGDDQALFAIDPLTGALRFLTSPDYETREDLNHDGIYNVVVAATDASGGVSTQAINIKVTDVFEPGKLINGGNGNDSLNGDTGGDIVLAGNGNDTVNANDGNDFVFGGNGDDLLRGGRGDDWIYGDNGDDALDGGLGKDLLFGDNGKDILKGGGNDDLLYGGNGNDVMDGGAGNDLLFGDNGNDRFVFGPDSGSDTVFDFRRGDIIEFQGDVFDSFAEVRAASRQVLGSTVIDLGDDTIVLIGVELRDLRASDFLFT
jgi:VCBS repeat-containing protein